jgi:hypothetical protein
MQRTFWVVLAVIIVSWAAASTECVASKIHEDAGTRGAQLLKMGVGAKAVGMGEWVSRMWLRRTTFMPHTGTRLG